VSNNDRQGKKGPEPGFTRFNFNNRIALITLIILIAFFVFFFVLSDRSGSQPLAYSVFLNYLDQGLVESVKIADQYEIQGALRTQNGELTFFKTTIPYPDPNLMQRMIDKGVKVAGGPRGVSPLRIIV